MSYWTSHSARAYQSTRGVLAVALCLVSSWAVAQNQPQMDSIQIDAISFSAPDPTILYADITIEQNLNAQIDMSLPFTTSEGKMVPLRDLMNDRPAILAFVYYDCPSLCTAQLEGLEIVVKAMKYVPGTDYNILTVSIDPDESPTDAMRKRDYHVGRVARDGAETGWKFLIGEEENIKSLADTVGFQYRYDEKNDIYAHAGGIMVLTPEGKIARYYYGTEYIKRDVEFGLMEASEGRIGSVVDRVIILCFQYDPAAGGYGLVVFRVMQLLSTLMVACFAGMYLIFYLRTRKKNDTTDAGTPLDGPQGVVH